METRQTGQNNVSPIYLHHKGWVRHNLQKNKESLLG